jgi:hypothetical protein
MSTPTPRTSAAIIASGFQAVPEGFRAFAGILERELTALAAECDQLRDELAKERARLDWLESSAATELQSERGWIDRAAIDKAMKEHAK